MAIRYICEYKGCGKIEPHMLAMADHTRIKHRRKLVKTHIEAYRTETDEQLKNELAKRMALPKGKASND